MDRRLTLISEMVRPCGTVADIGTDHGFLVCALVAAGRAERGIAADINPLPLEKARGEIAANGLGERVLPLLTDGLAGILLSGGDAVIIAGMGGELIARILCDWQQHTDPGIDYYLQPMTKPEKLRDYLYKADFELLEERCCVAAGRPYSVMRVRYCGKPQQPSPTELYLGEIDPQADEAAQKYCHKLLGQLQKRLRGIEGDGEHPEEEQLLREVTREILGRMQNEGTADI